MNNEKFNKVLDERIEKTKSVLRCKANEYASDQDRLHNFNVAAKLNSGGNITPEEACFGMLRKHIVSVMDMVQKSAVGVYPTKEMRDEKIGDTINYLILLEAIFIENGPPDQPADRVIQGTCAELRYRNET